MMATLHEYLSNREHWERAYERAAEDLEEELGREPTEDEIEARTDEYAADAQGDECDRAYDGWRDAQMLEGLERYDREREQG
jgi:DNA-directed RNA polymerase specialized sigma subunit